MILLHDQSFKTIKIFSNNKERKNNAFEILLIFISKKVNVPIVTVIVSSPMCV